MSLTQEQITKNKEMFIKLCKENIKRDGIDMLLNRLSDSDFFIAPCSTKYHLNYRGGLCQHSLNVYETLLKLCCVFDIDIQANLETLTIVSLFHDYCKADFYKLEVKPVKEGSVWVNKHVYTIDDALPLGHGEKSLFLVSRCIDVTDEEACAIRWHMSAFDNAFRGGEPAFNTASEKYMLVSLLSSADLLSSRVIEKVEELF